MNPVQLSFWALIAGPTSSLVGFCWLLTRMAVDGGKPSQIVLALRQQYEELLAVLLADFVAGLLAATTIGFFGITHPTYVVELINLGATSYIAARLASELSSNTAYSLGLRLLAL